MQENMAGAFSVRLKCTHYTEFQQNKLKKSCTSFFCRKSQNSGSGLRNERKCVWIFAENPPNFIPGRPSRAAGRIFVWFFSAKKLNKNRALRLFFSYGDIFRSKMILCWFFMLAGIQTHSPFYFGGSTFTRLIWWEIWEFAPSSPPLPALPGSAPLKLYCKRGKSRPEIRSNIMRNSS